MDKILITGKTGFFSEEALREISGTCSVLLSGSGAGQAGGDLPDSVRFFTAGPLDNDFARIFELGQIRAVWHVCSCADGGRAADERAQLETILRLCAENGVKRLVVLTESTDPTPYRELIREWSDPEEGDSVSIAVVHLPLVTGTGTGRGRLDRIFRAMKEQRTIRLDSGGVHRISVLPMQELLSLLLRMTSETWFSCGVYAADGTMGSIESLQEILQAIRPDARIITAGQEEPEPGQSPAAGGQKTLRCRIPVTGADACDGQLGELYRLPVSINWRSEITDLYTASVLEKGEESSGNRLLSILAGRFGKLAVPVLDLVVMFLIAEALSRITSESVYFKVVDVRILFVILMGMMHGLMTGAVAAILECIVLVMRYSEIGISGLLLFYNVENWIPFVYYLTAGVISGYSYKKRTQEIRSVNAENELIRNKYLFLNEAYRTSVRERSELRAQILNEEDSYAKVYGAVRRMAQRTPEAVCVEAVKVLRDLLENDTVCFYQMDSRQRKAELLSCSMENASRKSVDLARCPEMMQVLAKGDVWKNVRFLEEAPMYASIIRYTRDAQSGGTPGEISLLVTVEKAGQDQLNSWYKNHFEILCALFRNALEAASLRERTLS